VKNLIYKFDYATLNFLKRHYVTIARWSIFLVYFWFGGLKLFGLSPAGPLVQSLFDSTIPIMDFDTFFILFALFEMLIGVLFLVKGAERLVILLLILHLVATALPLLILPEITWQQFLVPTLEGQYIIKNILIIALALVIVAKIDFLANKKRP